MSKYPYRQDREELKALLQQFENLKAGKSNSFIEEDSFERIIDYYDEKEQLNLALEAAEYGIELDVQAAQTEADQLGQLAIMETMIEKGYDAL